MGLAKKIANKIIDAIVGAMGKLLGGAFDWIVGKLAGAVGLLVTPVGELMVYTPAPRPIGQIGRRPINSPWGAMYDAFWADMVPLGLLLLLVSYLVRQAAASFGVGDVATQRETQRGVIVGVVLIPSSWYLSTFLLQLFDALTRAVAPNMSNLSGILNQVAVSGNGLSAIFASVLMLVAGGAIYAAVLLLNVVRIAGMFTLVYGLPLLIAFDLGQFPYVGTISRRLIALLPTLAFMPLPTALGLRLSLIVFGQNGGLTISGLPASPLLNAVFLLAPGLLGIAIPFIVLRSQPFGQRIRGGRRLSTNQNPQRAKRAASESNPRDRLRSLRQRFSRDSTDGDRESTDTTSTEKTGATSRSQVSGLPTRSPSGNGRPELPSASSDPVSTDGAGRGRPAPRSARGERRPSFIATGDGYVVETDAGDTTTRGHSSTDTPAEGRGDRTTPSGTEPDSAASAVGPSSNAGDGRSAVDGRARAPPESGERSTASDDQPDIPTDAPQSHPGDPDTPDTQTEDDDS